MRQEKETLSSAATELEQLLAQKGHPVVIWAGRLARTLVGVEQAIRRHDAALESPEGEFIEVDSGQWPSQGMSRRVERLQGDLTGLLIETVALRGLAQRASEDDFAELRQRGAALVEALERYGQDEARLIMESVTTDIGAGD